MNRIVGIKFRIFIHSNHGTACISFGNSSYSFKMIRCSLFLSFCRTLDVQERKHHIPVVDRAPAEPAPALIAVVGPPKVGKSTLVRCLVKNFTRQKVTNIKGPITVVTSIVHCYYDSKFYESYLSYLLPCVFFISILYQMLWGFGE